MSKKLLVPNRRYTDEFKVEAVRLMDSVGVAEAGRRLSTSQGNLYRWRDKVNNGELSVGDGKVVPIKSGPLDLANENDRLRRELANAKYDLDILKKAAAAYFASQSRGNTLGLNKTVTCSQFSVVASCLKYRALVTSNGWFEHRLLGLFNASSLTQKSVLYIWLANEPMVDRDWFEGYVAKALMLGTNKCAKVCCANIYAAYSSAGSFTQPTLHTTNRLQKTY
jgi:transposase